MFFNFSKLQINLKNGTGIFKKLISASTYCSSSKNQPPPSSSNSDNDDSRKKNESDYELQLRNYVNEHWDDRVSRNDSYVQRLKHRLADGDRAALAESITLVESKNPTRKAQAEYLLAELLISSKKKLDDEGPPGLMFRVGITGSPGVGKSSFIEVFGKYLIETHQKKVAVLTVDPSSQTTGGSIMGDIVRMQELSRDPNAYLRSSATRGMLGGVAKGTQEAIILCEGAGYDWILIETVGVGQSESAVANIVDMVVVLISPTHGDELQGIKRGLMELADLVVVTKSDGDLQGPARITQSEFISALKLMRPRWPGVWKPKVLRTSSRTKEGITDVFTAAEDYRKALSMNGHILKQRHKQMLLWMWQHVEEEIVDLFRRHPQILKMLPDLEEDIRQGRTTAGLAAERLLREFLKV